MVLCESVIVCCCRCYCLLLFFFGGVIINGTKSIQSIKNLIKIARSELNCDCNINLSFCLKSSCRNARHEGRGLYVCVLKARLWEIYKLLKNLSELLITLMCNSNSAFYLKLHWFFLLAF